MEASDKASTSSDSPPVAAPSAYDQPDWANRTEDLACPLCVYNLRGLVEPRCPECGYQFTWPDLLDPARRRHPYLFELHPRSNFKSFWKTAFHGLWPGKFWRTLRADQPYVSSRLSLYWVIVSIATLLGIGSEFLYVLSANYISYRFQMARLRPAYAAYPPFEVPNADTELGAAGFLCLLVLAWPWLTFAALMIFRISMRRARINSSHVVRCIVYCNDIFLWAAIAAILINMARLAKFAYDLFAAPAGPPMSWRFYYSYERLPWTYWLWPVAVLIFAFRLIPAYANYLRFGHVIATILLTQILVLLFVAAIVFNVALAFSGQ